jgi:hypothetical protein
MKIQMSMDQDCMGWPHYYPACDKSKLFAKLLNQRTLTPDNMQILQQLGIEVEMLRHKL